MAEAREKQLEALYRLDPDEFVAARNELAKEIRSQDRKAATAIRNLAKPTVAAWAINQVALTKPKIVSAVIAATQDLHTAQQKAIGGDRGALKAAADKRRGAVGAVVEAAIAALEAHGRPTESHREAIRNTVEAASLDAETAAVLQSGRLEHELEAPAVFGDLGAIATEPTVRTERRTRRSGAETPEVDPEEIEREARRARAEAEDLAELAATARERAQEAAQRLRDAREALGSAEAALKEAQRGVDRAMDAAKTTSLRAGEIERRAEDAKAHADELEAAVRRG